MNALTQIVGIFLAFLAIVGIIEFGVHYAIAYNARAHRVMNYLSRNI